MSNQKTTRHNIILLIHGCLVYSKPIIESQVFTVECCFCGHTNTSQPGQHIMQLQQEGHPHQGRSKESEASEPNQRARFWFRCWALRRESLPGRRQSPRLPSLSCLATHSLDQAWALQPSSHAGASSRHSLPSVTADILLLSCRCTPYIYAPPPALRQPTTETNIF